jgi:hypothetical protein
MRWISRVLLVTALLVPGLASAEGPSPRAFRVWVFADAHVATDKSSGRESLATALRQSESASGFDWDVALDLGDMSGMQGTPKDEEGQEIVRQFKVLTRHRREQVYDLSAITTVAVSTSRRPGGGGNGSIPPANTPGLPGWTRRSGRFRLKAPGSATRFGSETCSS